jgi:hypothetical protein
MRDQFFYRYLGFVAVPFEPSEPLGCQVEQHLVRLIHTLKTQPQSTGVAGNPAEN